MKGAGRAGTAAGASLRLSRAPTDARGARHTPARAPAAPVVGGGGELGAAECMFSGRIKLCAFGRGNPRREMNQVESQSQRLLCTCFSAVSTSEMQGSQHEFESFRPANFAVGMPLQ